MVEELRTITVLVVVCVACGGVSEVRSKNAPGVEADSGTAHAGEQGSSGSGGGNGGSSGTSAGNGGSAGTNVGGAPSGGSGHAGASPLFDGGGGSTNGCRAPSEPGCASCCRQYPDSCNRLSVWGGDEYNVSETYGTICPTECPRCASCLLASEQTARNLVCRSDCDCSVPPGIDPCFAPTSCGCYCSGLKGLREECPELNVCP